MKAAPYKRSFSANKISERVLLMPGKAGWHYASVKKEAAEVIKDQYIWPRRGFGAIPVSLTVGQTTWKTSVFPEKGGTLFLPLKKEVRIKEGLKEGDKVTISLEVLN